MRRDHERPNIFITNRVFPEVVAFLETYGNVDANPSPEPYPRRIFLEKASGASAMMVFMNDSLDNTTIENCPKLRVIAAALKGYDNFDVAACTKQGIWFTIVPDLLTTPTAELAVALALGLARKLTEGDRVVRSGEFAGWRPVLYGRGLSGSTAGIFGMGNLGRALAKRLSAFEMEILYTDPIADRSGEQKQACGTRVELVELLTRSDFVFLTAPLQPDTLHQFDSSTLARMKPGSFLVNVGRGSVVDEEAVAGALERTQLAGYAADVFETEDWARSDRPRSINAALVRLGSKTLFTPHLGSAVADVRRKIETRAAQNIAEALRGRRPPDAINDVDLKPSTN